MPRPRSNYPIPPNSAGRPTDRFPCNQLRFTESEIDLASATIQSGRRQQTDGQRTHPWSLFEFVFLELDSSSAAVAVAASISIPI